MCLFLFFSAFPVEMDQQKLAANPLTWIQRLAALTTGFEGPKIQQVMKNTKRAALVWLDEHLEDYYKKADALVTGLIADTIIQYHPEFWPENLGRSRYFVDYDDI